MICLCYYCINYQAKITRHILPKIGNQIRLTCAMDFFAREFDIESIGGVSSTGQGHAELGRRHAQHLPSSLAKVRLEGIHSHAFHALQGVHFDLRGGLI